VSTPDPDSETAVTPTPGQTPAEPTDTAEAPTEQVKPVESADKSADKSVEKPAEPTETAEEPAESTEPVEAAVTPTDQPGDESGEPVDAAEEPTDSADETAEPVEAVEKPVEQPADEPTDEPVEASEEPTEVLATPDGAAAGPRSRRMLVPIVLAAVALGSAVAVAVLGWQAFSDGRAQRSQDAALDAARTGTTQVLSYDSKTLDADLARSRGLISGAFAAKFEELASGVIVPAVQQQSLATKATVARSAVIDAQPDQVTALLFVNQSTTVGADPAAHTASNQVRVTMTLADGHWLISDLQPL
jgi:Mce-associated membrane protein